MMDYLPGNTPGVISSRYEGHRGPQITQTITKPVPKGPEYNPWFWNPSNVSVRFAPDDFRKRLHEVDSTLEVTWNPITERWQVFCRAARIQTKVCRGWRLLFV